MRTRTPCAARSLLVVCWPRPPSSPRPGSRAGQAGRRHALFLPPRSTDICSPCLEGEFVGAAEAMPEDKFDFAPPATAGDFKGVRTFSEQVKHVTEANYYFFGAPAFPRPT